MALRRLWATTYSLATLVSAQFPPTPEGLTTKRVPSHPGVSISFKETCICETTSKAWSGYVHMPSSYLTDIETSSPYNISMFFWYFEARHSPETAPTAIYLAGGPGQSSLYGATSDGGPCKIRPDSNSTYTNDWSWNQHVNMLYVDQPVGSGYSYDTLVRGTQNLLYADDLINETGITPFEAYAGIVPEQNATFKYGTFASQNEQKTANTTGVAAVTLWHFTQVWFQNFPKYRTSNKRISIWGNSYGGYWVPASAAYLQRQNENIEARKINGTILSLDAAGITNGCIDMLYQAEWYPQMAFNNTYDLRIIPKHAYEEALNNYNKPDGCRDLMLKCRELGDIHDPQEFGINAKVNKICLQASLYCAKNVLGVFNEHSDRSVYDFSHKDPDPFPTSFTAGFFNRQWVQKELGSPVNFTSTSFLVNNIVLFKTGDPFRRAGMKDIEYLLDQGVKMTLIYGDRDYRCPWLGAENLSLSANWTGAADFRTAGYELIHTNKSYKGGVVRQHGNFSFSRVFEAGHDVSVYQPETTFRIFNRALFDKDVATGDVFTAGQSNNYTSRGPLSSYGFRDKLPPPPGVACYLYSAPATCTSDQVAALLNKTAKIDEGFNVVKPVGGGGPFGGSSGF